jgi:hypothetical protein
MSRLDELPPDQRAALSLLVQQRKTYAEVATLLTIEERAVHARVQAALAVLAPRQARELSAARREEVGDYLLGQQGVSDRLATRAFLSGSDPARRWAGAISDELAPLSSAPLPEIPDRIAPAPQERVAQPAHDPPRPTDALPAGNGERTGLAPRAGERLPSSRLGGALLLAGIAAAVIVAIVLITGGGSHAKKGSSASASRSTTGPAITQRLRLTSPEAGSRSLGVMEIIAEGSKHGYLIDAENLPESKGFFYALWLYNSPTSRRPLNSSPPVGSNHRLQGAAILPADAGKYHTILLTRETSRNPPQPGPVVLSGSFTL